MDVPKLHSSSSERDYYENLADVYSIINCLEHLEKAYIRDIIQPNEYTPTCLKLIAQYKTSLNLISDAKGSSFDLESFMKEYNMSCSAARSRLEIGVPATIEHTTGEASDSSKNVKYVSEIVQCFITLMDSLKLNMVAVDQLHPLLSDLMASLNKLTLPPKSGGINKGKIREWLVTLNKMRASDELDENQARQLLFDLDVAFSEFNNALK